MRHRIVARPPAVLAPSIACTIVLALGLATACNESPQYDFAFDAIGLTDTSADAQTDLGGVDDANASDAASDANTDAGSGTDASDAGDAQGSDADTDDASGDADARVCEPNLVTCDADDLLTCNEDGTVLTRTVCNETDACADAALGCACDAGACVPLLCAPGSGRCVGQAAQRCADDGLSYEAPTSCGEGVCQAGVCLPAGCTPGETTCAGDVALICADDGVRRDEVDCSDAGLICVTDASGSAGCDLPICEPRARTCVDGEEAVAICDVRGASETIQPCPDATFCEAGRCEPALCDPATPLFCDGLDVLRCVDGGRAADLLRTCESECVDGSCGSTCGDGVIDPGEQCDDGPAGSARCDDACLLDPDAACAATGERCAVVTSDGVPITIRLEVPVTVETLDVGVLMDITGSMGAEISALERSLTEEVVPTLRETWRSLGVGLATYADYPCDGFGSSGDRPFTLAQRVTTDEATVQAAIERLSAGGGADVAESLFEALYQVGSGRGRIEPDCVDTAPFSAAGAGIPGVADGTDGGLGFRPGSQRLVVAITDASSQEKGTLTEDGDLYPYGATEDETIRALRASGVRVVGAASSTGDATRTDLLSLARRSGAVVPACVWDGVRPAGCGAGQCCTGAGGVGEPAIDGECPLVYTFSGSNGEGLDRSLADGLTVAAQFTTFDATIRASEDSGAAACTLLSVEAIRATNEDERCLGAPTPTPIRQDGPVDGFAGVRADSVLTFEVTLSTGCLPAATEVREIPLVLDITTPDGFVLSQQPVRMLVPPSASTTAVCGDGVRDAGEACDDGNRVNDDGCSNACVPARCGDGVVQRAGNTRTVLDPRLTGGAAVCDDGGSCPLGGCALSERHTAPEHGICQALGFGRAVSADWGYGRPAEGAFLPADAYACFDYACERRPLTGLACSEWEWLSSLTCADGPEACDDGAANANAPDRCRPDCSAPQCGDGIIDSGEACDDGAANGNAPDACRATCRRASCGDGVVDSGEACDDGNTRSGDGCSSTCRTELDDPSCVDVPLASQLGVVATGSTDGAGNDDDSTCSESAPDVIHAWTAPASGTYAFTTTGSSFDTVLTLREWSRFNCSGALISCNDDISSTNELSQLTRTMVAGERILVIVDGGGGGLFTPAEDGPYTLRIDRL